MKDINFWRELVKRIKTYLKKNDFEVVVIENNSELTRFAQSYIHQNVAETDLDLTLKVINEDRISMVEVNSIDEQVLSKNIEKAIELAKVSPKLDYHYQLVKPQLYKIKSKYSEKTANFTPLKRARLINHLIKEVNRDHSDSDY
jgi:predicted Zn-dependent protease